MVSSQVLVSNTCHKSLRYGLYQMCKGLKGQLYTSEWCLCVSMIGVYLLAPRWKLHPRKSIHDAGISILYNLDKSLPHTPRTTQSIINNALVLMLTCSLQ